MNPEYELQLEVDGLKIRLTDTKALYLQVCHLMFFRFGITPTTNKLYQVVHKGSMTVVSEVLAQFWAELREKSRILVDNGGLPEEVRSFAGEAIAELWRRALVAAEAASSVYIENAKSEVAAAKADATAALAERDSIAQELSNYHEAVGRLQVENEALGQRIAVAESQRQQLEEQGALSRTQLRESQQAQVAAREAFSVEMEKVREQGRILESRYAENEKRVLVEVDRHRVENRNLKSQVEVFQSQLAREALKSEQLVAKWREQVAKLEGSSASMTAELGRYRTESELLHRQCATLKAELQATRPRHSVPVRKAAPKIKVPSGKRLRGNRSAGG